MSDPRLSPSPAAARVPVRADLADVEPYGAPQLDVAVRLNTNETPFPPPGAFFDQLAKRLAGLPLHRYPDRRAWALRSALGERFGLPPQRVWAAKGSNEVLLQLFQAYGGPGRRVLLWRPGYSAHPLIARVAATTTVEADLDDVFRLDADAARAAVAASDPDLICVASPNNPTGIAVPLDAVGALHDASRALVVVDEAYVEFGGESTAGLLDALPRLVVCRTFSKAWRLAGIRLGYLLAPDWVVDDLRKVRLPYHLDALTQEAGLVALELADEVTAHVAEVAAERDRLQAALRRLDGVEVFESAANFLLLRTGVSDLFARLLDRGVLVRDVSALPRLAGCLRVTVGSPAENDAFLAALRASLPAAADQP
ncbi:MAG: histidinol-phosphate transaminase [Actinomycetota bacterium]|nr:histidinol-phosphate transaminase [Actinomycetota bacterium]